MPYAVIFVPAACMLATAVFFAFCGIRFHWKSPSSRGSIRESTCSEKQNLLKHLFPPSRRRALASSLSKTSEVLDSLETEQCKHQGKGNSPECLAATSQFRDQQITPTGISYEEVQRLGRFPDYATLSGVPSPHAYADFAISKAKPRPFRPLRWPYHQTMSLSKLEPDWWIELESTYERCIKQRQELFLEHGPMVLQTLDGSESAATELMEMVLQFLCARYPKYFELDPDNLTFHNRILRTETNLRTALPLRVLLDNVPEDFAIMLRDPETGFYAFRAGVICSSIGWTLGSKIGLRLHEIHEPVPEYREKMQMSMDRFFAKLPTDKPIQRGSWGITLDEELFEPSLTASQGKSVYEGKGSTQEKLSELVERCKFRVDWQTLRRLPLSGAVVFNFKALFTPITELRKEPYIPSLLLKILISSNQSFLDTKVAVSRDAIMAMMKEYEKHQETSGLIVKDWEPSTLDEAPFFPLWEEIWHKEQEF